MFAASGGTTSSEFIIFPHSPLPLRNPTLHMAAKLGGFGDDPGALRRRRRECGTGPNSQRVRSLGRATEEGPVRVGLLGTDRGTACDAAGRPSYTSQTAKPRSAEPTRVADDCAPSARMAQTHRDRPTADHLLYAVGSQEEREGGEILRLIQNRHFALPSRLYWRIAERYLSLEGDWRPSERQDNFISKQGARSTTIASGHAPRP